MKHYQERAGLFFFIESNISTNMKNIFTEVQGLMDRLNVAEERNGELENKARKIIQNAVKEIKT